MTKKSGMQEKTEIALQTKYNYVFYKVAQDYSKLLYFPMKQYDCVRVYDRTFDGNIVIQKIFFLHWSNKINERIRLPYKHLWFRRICKQDFKNDKPCCYFFNGGKYLREAPELYTYIKKMNPQNKVVAYFADLIERTVGTIDDIRGCTDKIFTYDVGDAEKYHIEYLHEPVYGSMIDVTEPKEFQWDVYFLGFAKDRLERIHRCYQTLTKAGLRCKFIICGTKPEDRIIGDGLIYQEPISYLDNLKNVSNSRCILELMQGGSNSATLRAEEAITYRRKLLTDYVSIMDSPRFSPSFVSTFDEPEHIDISFASKPIDYSVFSNCKNAQPSDFIMHLEKLLEQ